MTQRLREPRLSSKCARGSRKSVCDRFGTLNCLAVDASALPLLSNRKCTLLCGCPLHHVLPPGGQLLLQVHAFVSLYACACVCVSESVSMHVRVVVSMRMCVCVSASICEYACACVCACCGEYACTCVGVSKHLSVNTHTLMY